MLYPAHLAALKPYFDAVRMKGRAGQNVSDYAASQPPAALIFFQYNVDRKPLSNVISVVSVHRVHDTANIGAVPEKNDPRGIYPRGSFEDTAQN